MKNYYICKEVLEKHKSGIPTDTYNRIINDLDIAFNDIIRKKNISMSSTIADLREDIELFKLIIYHLLED
jgi:glutathionyl-hydroquinone reductase